MGKLSGLVVFMSIVLLSCASAPVKNTTMIADVDPLPAGSLQVQFDKDFSTALEEKTVEVVFCPRDNSVYLQFKYQFLTFKQYWDEPARQHFVEALQQYHTDYEAHDLNTKRSKTRKIYGVVAGKTEWQTFSFTASAYALPKMEIGYGFNGKNPYFTVLQQDATQVAENNSDPKKQSLRITLYFTRNQADTLAGLFDQDYLLGLLETETMPPPTNSASDWY
jgi:hypothetical protein